MELLWLKKNGKGKHWPCSAFFSHLFPFLTSVVLEAHNTEFENHWSYGSNNNLEVTTYEPRAIF